MTIDPRAGRPRRARAAPRGLAALLADPQFGGVFWGKFFSFAGVTVHTLVISVLAFEVTGSTMAVALVNTALFLPQFLIGPWSGTISDRGWGVAQIISGRATAAFGTGALALCLAVADPRGWWAVALISATCVVAGAGLAFGAAAMNSVVPQMVTREEMPLAMTLNTAPITAARVLGPVLGAWVLAGWGAEAALWVAAAGHVIFALAVALARPSSGPRLPRSPEAGIGPAWHHVRRVDPVLLRLLVAVAVVSFGAEPAFVLAPAYAAELGGGTSDVGWLSASFGVGAALGLGLSMFLEGRLPQQRVAFAGLVGLAVAALGCAAAPGFWAAHLSFGILGVAFTLAMGAMSTLVQLRVPPLLRGRVMALWILALVGGRPIVSLVTGGVADTLGVELAFVTAAVLVAVSLAWLRPSRLGGPVPAL